MSWFWQPLEIQPAPAASSSPAPVFPERVLGRASAAHLVQSFAGPIVALAAVATTPPPSIFPHAAVGPRSIAHLVQSFAGSTAATVAVAPAPVSLWPDPIAPRRSIAHTAQSFAAAPFVQPLATPPSVFPDAIPGHGSIAHLTQSLAWSPTGRTPSSPPSMWPDLVSGRPSTAHAVQAFAGPPVTLFPPPAAGVWPDRIAGSPSVAHLAQAFAWAPFVPPPPPVSVWPDAVQGPASRVHTLQAFAGPLPAIAAVLVPPSWWPDRVPGPPSIAHLGNAWSGPLFVEPPPPPPVSDVLPIRLRVIDGRIEVVVDPGIQVRVLREEIRVTIVGVPMADRRAVFRQGSTHEPLRAVAFRASGVVNLLTEFPGGITFRMVRGSTVIVGPASGDSSGNLVYQWAAHDLDATGNYQAYFIGTDGFGRTDTLPVGPPEVPNLEVVVLPTI